jgi:hypothetical protein
MSRQSNWRLEVSADASRTDETTRNMEASFVNALPFRPFAKRKMKTSGPESAAIPPSNPPQKPAPRPTGPIIRCLICSFGASSVSAATRMTPAPATVFATAGSTFKRTATPIHVPGIIPTSTGARLQSVFPTKPPSSACGILLKTSGMLSSITAVCTSTSIDNIGNAAMGMPTPIMPLTKPAITRLTATSTIKPGVAVSMTSANMRAARPRAS